MKSNRSDKFNYFTDPNSDEHKRKNLLKRIWFWVKIVIYTLIFGITMTGCIQTFVIKSSTYTGGGTEFYTKQSKIAPTVNTFYKSQDKELQKDEFYILDYNRDANYYVNANTKQGAETIDALRKQTENTHGEYGKYNSYSSAIQIKNEPTLIVQGENGNWLFRALSSTAYKSIFNKDEAIEILDPNFTLSKFFDDKSKLKTKTVLNQLTLKDNSNPYYAYQEVDEQNKLKTFAPVKLATMFVIPKESEFGQGNYASNEEYKGPNQKYARDVFQYLYEFTIENPNNVYKRVLKEFNSKHGTNYQTFSAWVKAIIDINDHSLDNIIFTNKEIETLEKYQNAVQSYLEKTKLGVSNDFIENRDKAGKIVPKSFIKGLYGHNYEPGKTIYPQTTLGLPKDPNAPSTSLLLTTSEPQKAIWSWGQAWKHWGPFFGLFVWPVAWLTASIREPLPNWDGWATVITILIAVIITRLIVLLITFKSQVNQSKQEDLRAKKAKIDAKYIDFKGNKQMKARQQQEVAALYRKNNINPLDAFVNIIITIPIFLAMWRVIQSIPSLKSTHWLGMDFSATSYKRLFAGEWQYLFILVVAVAVQVLSQLTPRLLTRKKTKERITIEEQAALKKNNKIQNITMIVFIIFTVIFSCGVQVYWIFSGLWMILQAIGIHYFKKSKFYREKFMNKKTA